MTAKLNPQGVTGHRVRELPYNEAPLVDLSDARVVAALSQQMVTPLFLVPTKEFFTASYLHSGPDGTPKNAKTPVNFPSTGLATRTADREASLVMNYRRGGEDPMSAHGERSIYLSPEKLGHVTHPPPLPPQPVREITLACHSRVAAHTMPREGVHCTLSPPRTLRFTARHLSTGTPRDIGHRHRLLWEKAWHKWERHNSDRASSLPSPSQTPLHLPLSGCAVMCGVHVDGVVWWQQPRPKSVGTYLASSSGRLSSQEGAVVTLRTGRHVPNLTWHPVSYPPRYPGPESVHPGTMSTERHRRLNEFGAQVHLPHPLDAAYSAPSPSLSWADGAVACSIQMPRGVLWRVVPTWWREYQACATAPSPTDRQIGYRAMLATALACGCGVWCSVPWNTTTDGSECGVLLDQARWCSDEALYRAPSCKTRSYVPPTRSTAPTAALQRHPTGLQR